MCNIQFFYVHTYIVGERAAVAILHDDAQIPSISIIEGSQVLHNTIVFQFLEYLYFIMGLGYEILKI